MSFIFIGIVVSKISYLGTSKLLEETLNTKFLKSETNSKMMTKRKNMKRNDKKNAVKLSVQFMIGKMTKGKLKNGSFATIVWLKCGKGQKFAEISYPSVRNQFNNQIQDC